MTTPRIGVVDTQDSPEVCSVRLLDITNTAYMDQDIIIGHNTLGRVVDVKRTFRLRLLPESHDHLFLTVQLDNPAQVLGQPVRLAETSRPGQPAYPTWININAFYTERGGAPSIECDYGVHNWIRLWRPRTTPWDQWRVSVVVDTGDVYATNNSNIDDDQQVVLLGTIRPLPEDHLPRSSWRHHVKPIYAAAERVFKGWAENTGPGRHLSWFSDRITGQAHQTTDEISQY